MTALGNSLLLGWRGSGNNWLNVMQSSDGRTWGNKVTLGDTTVARPQLLTAHDRALLTWQGVGNLQLNLLSSPDGAHWENKLTSKETCIGGPALAALGPSLVWGWTGTDAAHHLNALKFDWF